MEFEYQFWAVEAQRRREARELRAARRAQRIIGSERQAAVAARKGDGPGRALARQSLVARRLE